MSSENSSIHCTLSLERHRYWMEDSKSCQFPRKALKQNIRKGIKRAKSSKKKNEEKRRKKALAASDSPWALRFPFPYILHGATLSDMIIHESCPRLWAILCHLTLLADLTSISVLKQSALPWQTFEQLVCSLLQLTVKFKRRRNEAEISGQNNIYSLSQSPPAIKWNEPLIIRVFLRWSPLRRPLSLASSLPRFLAS